jgi:small subunit ribosomal protein S6
MDQKTKTYEGMFLLDANNADFQVASEPVRNILTRYEAEILSCKPWDDRKLVYDIRGHKRGLYILTYFRADPLKIKEIEHDCELDERFLRQLILRRDRLSQEQIDAETPATSGVRPTVEIGVPDESRPAPMDVPIDVIADIEVEEDDKA